ncbi:MAG: hypothetical protein DLM54_08130 [Acidimicrobiales bacterium]|nr:MAG: hypothetical protein DLM54_08130 [Acidimicrobiales bacterium]
MLCAPLVAVIVLAMVAAACSKSNKSASKRTNPPQATSSTLPPTYPLTGLPATDTAKAARPALSVKIDNVTLAQPQVGLDGADVVFEEVVEGGLTRLLTIFQSNDASPLGPVRSVRPTDPNLVAPFGGIFAYSGGSDRFDKLIRSTPGITAVSPSDDGGAFPRRSVHAAPHNQYTSTPALYKHSASGAKPPPPFSPFLAGGQPFAPPGAAPATRLAASVGMVPVAYDWDPAAGRWKRSMNGKADTLENGKQLTATTVILQFVAYTPVAGATDPTGAQVFEAQVIGSGDAWVLANGMVVKGKWSKPAQSSVTSYTDAAGAPISLPPGQTWVEVAQTGAATSTS